MQCLILTNHSEKVRELAALTIPNKQLYADKNGYDFISMKLDYNANSHVFWLRTIRDKLRTYDTVLTMGFDTIFTNRSILIEDIIKPFDSVVIARENISHFPINNDVMLWKSCYATRAIIDKLIEDADIWLKMDWLWQNHLWNLICQKQVAVRLVDARVMNSTFQPFIVENGQAKRIPGPSSWQIGDWIFHALDMPIPMKLQAIKWALQFVSDGGYYPETRKE